MKFDLHKFLTILNAVGPVVLMASGGGPIATLVPVIIHAIGEAEQIKGATGAQKKAHVLAIVEAGVATANATGKVTLNPTEVHQVADDGIDAVLGTIQVIEGAKVVKALPPAA